VIARINSLKPLPDYKLAVAFDDGKRVTYDVKEDMHLPGYGLLREVNGLFQQVQLDQSRTCVFWNDEIDLPSDAIYEYGIEQADEADLRAYEKAKAEYDANPITYSHDEVVRMLDL